MRRAALIYNPASGRRRHALVLDPVLAALGRAFTVETLPTTAAGDATRLAADLARTGAGTVFAFGGDGTVREVAAGLLGTGAVLGILPGGTTNVLARALGLPADPVAAAAQAGELPARPIDVGLCGCCPFLMMVSAGLDAAVLAGVDIGLKGRFGKAAIVSQGFREWWRYGYPPLEVTADGEPLAASFVAVTNIPLYAGAFRLVPHARPDDRQLELLLFSGAGRLPTLFFGFDLLRAVHVRRRDVAVREVREVVLRGPAGVRLQLDGDVCAEPLPVTIRLAPEPLPVLAPVV